MTAKPNAAPPAFAFPTASHPEEAEKVRPLPSAQPGEDQLDDAIAHSFPASDPVSVTVSPVPKDEAAQEKDEKEGQGDKAAATGRAQPAMWTAAAVVSTALVGVGAALLWGRQRRTAKRAVPRLAAGLWSQLGQAAPKPPKLHLPRRLRP